MAGQVTNHKLVLNQLSELIGKEEDCLSEIYIDCVDGPAAPDMEDIQNTLQVTRQKTGEEFIVLVIGAFSAGKSSMINALVGEELLPTGFLPETAVLGELHYGIKKQITLYPKKGMWEGGDAPFDLKETTASEIAKYASLTADDAVNNMQEGSEKRIESKFEKMVIRWPLEILRDGVVLVDSPGINDPYSNDYIVNGYLPKADAIIYIMDAQHAYQKTDAQQLTSINSIGRRNIITGYTFYDIVLQGNRRKPEALEKIRETLIHHMEKHTDLPVESIHFLSSMEALDGKLDGDPEKVRSSGYEGLENYLAQYLVEGKGRDQVRNMAFTICQQAKRMMKRVELLDQAANRDVEELKKQAAHAEQELSSVRNQSFNMARTFRMQMESYIPQVQSMAERFLRDLANKVDLEDFEPETHLPAGIGQLNIFEAKKRAKALQEECQQELEHRMNIAYRDWSAHELSPYLENAVRDCASSIRPGLEEISRNLEDITCSMTGSGSVSSGTVSNIAVGLVYAMLTGDWFTGGMSAVYGKGAMARGVAFQAAAGIGLGLLMSMGVAISLPMVVVAGMGAAILGVITSNVGKKEEKIKSEAVNSLRKNYSSAENEANIAGTVKDIVDNVRDYIESACNDMEDALKRDIQETEANIQQIIRQSELDQDKKRAQSERRHQAVDVLLKIQRRAEEICAQYGITDLSERR